MPKILAGKCREFALGYDISNEFHQDATDLYYQMTALYQKMSDGRSVEVYFSLREYVR